MTKTVPSYIRLHHNSDYPPEGGIYAFFSDTGLPIKLVSIYEWSKMNAGNFSRRARWIIWSTGFSTSYSIQDGGRLNCMVNKEKFLSNIENIYPEDLEFFLWNLDLLELVKK